MGVPRIWLNCDEFVDLFKSQLEPLIKNQISADLNIFDACTQIMSEIYDLIPDEKFKDLAKKIDDIIFNLGYSGDAKVEGARVEIPPLMMDYDHMWKPPEKIILTGIQFELTGWKPYDRYSLLTRHFSKTGKLTKTQLLVNNVPFKEIGEHKVLPIAYPFGMSRKNISLSSTDEVVFRVHNKSGNSRQVYLDYEYLSLGNLVLPPSGSTILFLDVSGSMQHLLFQMSQYMLQFLQNLSGTDPVSICFVAGIGDHYTKGSYVYIRKDFANKYLAIAYLSLISNIPIKYGGGWYDIVTVKCVLDYKISNFTNYIFCTDQILESAPDEKLIEKLQDFFNPDQNVYSIPTSEAFKEYWNNTYNNLGLFKPIDI